MKNTILSAIAIAFLFSSCKQDVQGCMDANSLGFDPLATVDDGSCSYPQQKHYPLLVYATGFWCHVCGENGVPAFDQLVSTNHNLSAISIHYSESSTDKKYQPAIADSLTKKLGTPSVPDFYLNSDQTNSNVPPYVNNEVNSEVSSAAAKPVIAAIDVVKKVTGYTVEVEAAVKFFAQLNGNCRLSIFVVEDSLYHKQSTDAGYVNKYHRNTLRACAGEWSGDPLGGSFSAGEMVKRSYTVNMPVDVKMENVKVVAVLWQMGVNQNTAGFGFKDRIVLNTFTR